MRRQDRSGTWGGGLYLPKWLSTTYTMLLLRDLGLRAGHRAALRACALLLSEGLRKDGGINYGPWGSRGETCITGMMLSILCTMGYGAGKGSEKCIAQRVDVLADHLLQRQMPDGGWNCQRPCGATHASVHTNISTLEGLRDHELHGALGAQRLKALCDAQQRGSEFLLAHRMFRSHRTGAVIKPVLRRLAFPSRWHYDILRGLDYFQSVGAPRDERLAEAIDVLVDKRGTDGRWRLEHRFPGRAFFEMERLGGPSRWNTLRAMRVLRWWEGRRTVRDG